MRPSDKCDAHQLSKHMEEEASYKARESLSTKLTHGAKSQIKRVQNIEGAGGTGG